MKWRKFVVPIVVIGLPTIGVSSCILTAAGTPIDREWPSLCFGPRRGLHGPSAAYPVMPSPAARSPRPTTIGAAETSEVGGNSRRSALPRKPP
jgi:hypothetical protein